MSTVASLPARWPADRTVSDDVVDRLLAERFERVADTVVTAAAVERWCGFFGEDRLRHRRADGGRVVPPLMLTSFARPVAPPSPGEFAPAGVVLHDRLKEELGLPIGIAIGYELECHALLHEGDRLHAVERIATVGPLRDTRFGPGRDWVIEVATANDVGDLVGMERWSMLGYRVLDEPPTRPSGPVAPGISVGAVAEVAPDFAKQFMATRESIVTGATVNRVWAAAHHDDDAARAAGLPGIILDTSSWVSMFGRAAADWLGGDPRPGSVSLSMRRPVLADDIVELVGTIVADLVDSNNVRWIGIDIVAAVSGRVVSSAGVRLAVATVEGADVWSLGPDRWFPSAD
jgi:hypothetical protein